MVFSVALQELLSRPMGCLLLLQRLLLFGCLQQQKGGRIVWQGAEVGGSCRWDARCH